ncbi:unnamed protein product [Timema podura]|uniref:Uncharacterized protein n=1 Tax=Timema podura TaxID=61482 RepID=A0ABN7NHB3_TIMPD|nr:unnamed protein product [Timema podura]
MAFVSLRLWYEAMPPVRVVDNQISLRFLGLHSSKSSVSKTSIRAYDDSNRCATTVLWFILEQLPKDSTSFDIGGILRYNMFRNHLFAYLVAEVILSKITITTQSMNNANDITSYRWPVDIPGVLDSSSPASRLFPSVQGSSNSDNRYGNNYSSGAEYCAYKSQCGTYDVGRGVEKRRSNRSILHVGGLTTCIKVSQ